MLQWVKDPALPQLWRGVGCSYGLDSIPNPGTSMFCGCSQKKEKKIEGEKKEKTKKTLEKHIGWFVLHFAPSS